MQKKSLTIALTEYDYNKNMVKMTLFQSIIKKLFSVKHAYFYVIISSNILWIIALSTVLNSFFSLIIEDIMFATGLGISSALDFYLRDMYPSQWLIHIIPLLFFGLLFFIFSLLSKKKYSPILLIAFILYFADTLLFVYLHKYLTIILRGIFLLILYYGWRGALYMFHHNKANNISQKN